LRAFENRVLRRIFGPKGDEVRGGCRKLYSEELHDFCSSLNIIIINKSRRMRWKGRMATMEKRNAYSVLVGKPERKKPLRRPRCRWADNIRMDHVEMRRGGRDWIGLARDMYRRRALVNAVMSLRVP
jgi:hypothetical protein